MPSFSLTLPTPATDSYCSDLRGIYALSIILIAQVPSSTSFNPSTPADLTSPCCMSHSVNLAGVWTRSAFTWSSRSSRKGSSGHSSRSSSHSSSRSSRTGSNGHSSRIGSSGHSSRSSRIGSSSHSSSRSSRIGSSCHSSSSSSRTGSSSHRL